jgi:hypothetical protein
MAVAQRRPGFTVWMAWVGAGALGAGLAALASQPGSEDLAGAPYLGPVVLAAPIALLQFLVLRGLCGFSVVAAGVWVVVTVVAPIADLFAVSGWYVVVPQFLPRLPLSFGTATDILFYGGDYIKPLLLGLAQGVVLAWFFRHWLIAAWWVAINLVAYAGAIQGTAFAFVASGFALDENQAAGYLVVMVALAALSGAVTGLALIAILRMRPQASAPSLPRAAV